MTLLVMVGLFFLLMLIGTPVYVFLGLPAALVMLSLGNLPWPAVAARVFEHLTSDVMVAVPMYILLGNVLTTTSAARYLVAFLDTLVRHFPGGLAIVAILASMFVAGITGSSTAEAAILALTLAGPMAEAGYRPRFTAGLLAAGSTLGILIPPSIPMLLYSAITGESPSALFMAGLLPGLVVGGMLISAAVLFSIREGYGRRPRATWSERGVAFWRALPVLTIPIFIVGGLYSGLATATETGAVAAAAGLFIAGFVYRELTPAKALHILLQSARTSGMLLLIIGTSALFGWILTYQRVPQLATQFVVDLGLSPILFLLAMNVLLLIMGIPLEPPPILFISMPIIYPILAVLGISPIHFAVIMMVNLQIAQVSPPVGMSLYAVSSLAKIPADEVFKGVMPFIGILLVGLALITYWPPLSLALVR